MKRYIKAVSMVCALAATTTLCAGALAEDSIPKLADGGRVAAPVLRAMTPDTPDIVRLAEADVLVKAGALGQIDKSVELGTDEALALKNPVERVVMPDGAAAEKSQALDADFTKKDVERVVMPDGAAAEKSLALGADFTKKDVERVVMPDGAAAEKSLALDADFTKKDVERVVMPDGAAAEKSLALDADFTKKDIERAVAIDAAGISRDAALGTDAAYTAKNDAALTTEDNVLRSVQLGDAEPIARQAADVERAAPFEGGSVEKAAALDDELIRKDVERIIPVEDIGAVKSLALDDAFAKNDIERAILIEDVGAVKSLALDDEFVKKDVERAVAPEDIGAEKSGALEATEPFVKKDANMVDRAIEDAGATKVINPFEPEEGGDIVRGASDEMIDKRVIAEGEISEKRTDKVIDIELGRDDIGRGIALGDGGEVVRSQSVGGESGIGRLGEGEVIRP